MRLTIRLRFLGLDLLDVDLSTDSSSPEPDDTSRDLSGGNLGSDRIDPGPTDRFMGFTNGLEVE